MTSCTICTSPNCHGWRRHAACHGRTDLFFPADDDANSALLAREVCQTCPVQPQCLDVSIENNEQFGIWGGADLQERRLIAKERRRVLRPIVHGTNSGYLTHWRRGEKPCERCREAHAAYARDWKWRRREGAGDVRSEEASRETERSMTPIARCGALQRAPLLELRAMTDIEWRSTLEELVGLVAQVVLEDEARRRRTARRAA